MSAWSHLPNAALIDRIIADVQARPEAWATAWHAAQAKVRYEVRGAAYNAALGAARLTARGAIVNAALDAAHDAAYSSAYYAAQDAILALVAYDDCAQYLRMTPDQLLVWYHLSEHPACTLLLPMVITLKQVDNAVNL